MPHYSTEDDYIHAWDEVVLPIIHQFKPRLIVVSAGFDGFLGENLTTLRLSEAFFAHAGATLSRYSLAVIFEGGYSVGLDKGLAAFIKGYLSGKAPSVEVSLPHEAVRVVARVKKIQGEWWEL